MKKYSFMYSGIPVEYTLYRKDIKNINIRINKEGEINVSAPKGVKLSDVQSFVENKGDWIIRNLAEMEQKVSSLPDNDFYSGKTVYVLGLGYTLNIIPADKNKITMTEKEIILYTIHTEDTEKIRQMYLKFLTAIAKDVFEAVLDKVIAAVGEDYCGVRPAVSIKNMHTRWGSCNSELKKINLNLQLIKADEECIEQVILHEMVHMKISGHGDEFYRELAKYMPDWSDKKRRLENNFKDGIN